MCSPLEWGWSRQHRFHAVLPRLLPVSAGMVPSRTGPAGGGSPAPRARGGGPKIKGDDKSKVVCSPRPRGWSQQPTCQPPEELLLSVPAGMVPTPTATRAASTPAPRARGDGPSHHPMGGKWGLLPATWVRPGEDMTCSSRPRGWSRGVAAEPGDRELLLAPAGMVPSSAPIGGLMTAAPSTRGDGPEQIRKDRHAAYCSPHSRGWSLAEADVDATVVPLSAPVGMVPAPARSGRRRTVAPSHPRGWSRAHRNDARRMKLLPVPAGMVPARPETNRPFSAAPRTRGGPAPRRGPQSRRPLTCGYPAPRAQRTPPAGPGAGSGCWPTRSHYARSRRVRCPGGKSRRRWLGRL